MEIQVEGIKKNRKKHIVRSVLAVVSIAIIILGYQIIYPRFYYVTEGIALGKHGKELDILDNQYTVLSEIEAELGDYELYLTGESHATQANYSLWEYFTKFFVEKADVRYILLESGYGVGELLNNYLETGDEDYLYDIMKAFQGSPAYNQAHHQYYQKIYAYNQTLPEDKKIRFVGIDVEHQQDLAMQYLQEVCMRENVPVEIQEVVEEIQQWSRGIRPRKVYLDKWQDSYETYEALYKEWLGEDYFGFGFVIENIGNSTEDQPMREAAIISNFKKVYEYLPKGKYYGQWGSYHTSLETHVKSMSAPFATVVNESYEPVQGKVLSILYRYNNCERMETSGGAVSLDNAGLYKAKEYKALPLITTTDIPAFQRKMPGIQGTYAKSRNDLYDYIIVIPNSPAALPLE